MSWLGGAVLLALDAEDRVLADACRQLFVLRRAAHRQKLEHRPLDGQPLDYPGVHARDDLLDERLVAGSVVEAARAAQAQGLVERGLERVVARLDRAVLVRLAGVAAARAHAVVPAQVGVAARQILLFGQVLEGRREAVGAVFLGHAAELPQRALQAGGQRNEALAAGDDHRMAPAGMGEHELVETMVESRAFHDDVELVGHGEVGQPQAAWRMLLREVDLAFGAVRGPPLPQAALQGAKHALVIGAWMAALKLLEQRDGVELVVDTQQRDDF